MKTFTFKYDPHGPGVSKKILSALKGRRSSNPDELVSRDLKILLEVATPTRLSIFEAIVSRKPGSLYDLAKLMGLSQSLVLKEARILEALGLVSLRLERVGLREKLRPEAQYSRVLIDCGFRECAS